MAIQLDFTGVEALNFFPVPPGKYHCTVAGVKPKAASTGSKMLEWVMQVETDEFAGRRLFLNTVLTEKSLWKTKQCLLALGFTEDELEGNFELDPVELVGLECIVVAGVEEYQGVERNSVDRFEPIFEGAEGEDWADSSGAPNSSVDSSPELETAEEVEEALASISVEDDDSEEEEIPVIKVTKTAQALLTEYSLTAEEVAAFYDDGKALSKLRVQAFIEQHFEEEEE